MANLSFARIMYGTSEGVRTNSGLGPSDFSSQTALSTHSISTPDVRWHGGFTLESLLHKAWLALSTKH